MAIDIQELNLEDVMGDRYGRYSKYIIQDRALPDIRDGLKPVQRRILYAMYEEGNTSHNAFRKSAKTVGNVIGNYHPHGDTSVYDAMVRMSQEWKNEEPLIEMHGNNGSMDGDPAAAMRYTEARLSPIADELLQDLDKETVDTILNFDDTEEEPIVLPAGFPNLLVNGAQGISAGYATEIPTHNLGEVIDATIYFIDHPNASLSQLMRYIPGPDFPTGGIIQGAKELEKAYRTGRGKVVLRGQSTVESLRSGREQIVINQIPFEVNKAELVRKMDELRLNHSVEGIAEVRDESDRNGLRIVIELKKEADAQQILNYYYKNTSLQINYNFNMVAIDQLTPKQVGLKAILSAYVTHRSEIIERRTTFNLDKAKRRLHIVEGLIKAVSILDEVITTIRRSQNKRDAKNNLQTTFQFTEVQSEAIVSLQLYRLTNTDITSLQEEEQQLNEDIAHYIAILNDKDVLLDLIKTELQTIKKKYERPRVTQIEAEIEEIKIKKEFLISEEQVMVVVTRNGYIKRTSLRSYQSSKFTDLGLREGDHVLYFREHSTLDNLIFITTKGRYIYQPVYELQEKRWKDLGEHISQRISFDPEERLLYAETFNNESQANLLLTTKEGMIKQTPLNLFTSFRGYKTRSTTAIKLGSKADELVNVQQVNTPIQETQQILILTYLGYCLRYPISEISQVGLQAKGVKAINLKKNDHVVNSLYLPNNAENAQFLLATQRGTMKRLKYSDIELMKRANRGLLTLKEVKTHPYRLVAAYPVQNTNQYFEIYGSNGQLKTIRSGDIPLAQRYSNGSSIVNEQEFGEIVTVTPIMAEEIKEA